MTKELFIQTQKEVRNLFTIKNLSGQEGMHVLLNLSLAVIYDATKNKEQTLEFFARWIKEVDSDWDEILRTRQRSGDDLH